MVATGLSISKSFGFDSRHKRQGGRMIYTLIFAGTILSMSPNLDECQLARVVAVMDMAITHKMDCPDYAQLVCVESV